MLPKRVQGFKHFLDHHDRHGRTIVFNTGKCSTCRGSIVVEQRSVAAIESFQQPALAGLQSWHILPPKQCMHYEEEE